MTQEVYSVPSLTSIASKYVCFHSHLERKCTWIMNQHCPRCYKQICSGNCLDSDMCEAEYSIVNGILTCKQCVLCKKYCVDATAQKPFCVYCYNEMYCDPFTCIYIDQGGCFKNKKYNIQLIPDVHGQQEFYYTTIIKKIVDNKEYMWEGSIHTYLYYRKIECFYDFDGENNVSDTHIRLDNSDGSKLISIKKIVKFLTSLKLMPNTDKMDSIIDQSVKNLFNKK